MTDSSAYRQIFLRNLFGNVGKFMFLKILKILFILLKIKFFYVLNCFNTLISKIILKK
jgi:hypothetical protein